ncbi:hypothetical protein [Bdellovibrio svalbardensis]|uniref:Uncharacterized protein n=1 Tax=Bdellovibrio svalbardensis TaxID=2972972 RepID=A0ABT6DQR5_9BACT|nr:hypothetical protein [Bdellovibrio svalbardensis]MDG0817503.1 hypothetical protein [Bdellovibrio svalbardensis]
MGQKAKWLQDERYIRIAGALLMVSPIMNLLVSVALNSNVVDKWSLKNLFAAFMLASGLAWLGRISNFVVGFLMFRGKNTAWVPVLAILGFTIAKNFITFKQDYQTNHFQAISSLLINILLFLLVFESEYRLNKELNNKLQAARARQGGANTNPSTTKSPTTKEAPLTASVAANIKKATPLDFSYQKPASSPAPQKSFIIKKRMPIEFAGHGKIAEVIHCTEDELWLKPTNHLPNDIHKKTVTLEDPKQGGKIRLKFSGIRDDSTLVFRLVPDQKA